MFGNIHMWNHQSRAFVCWEVLITASVSLGVICLLRFSDSSWFIFGRLFLGIYLFNPCCPVCCHIMFIIFSYSPLYFFGVICYFSSLNSDFIYLGPLSFFLLMSLVKGLSVLFIFSKNQLLYSLTFCIIFLDSVSFISTLIFIICFPVLTLGIVCCSFIWAFSYFSRKGCPAMNFPLRTAFP